MERQAESRLAVINSFGGSDDLLELCTATPDTVGSHVSPDVPRCISIKLSSGMNPFYLVAKYLCVLEAQGRWWACMWSPCGWAGPRHRVPVNLCKCESLLMAGPRPCTGGRRRGPDLPGDGPDYRLLLQDAVDLNSCMKRNIKDKQGKQSREFICIHS